MGREKEKKVEFTSFFLYCDIKFYIVNQIKLDMINF